MRAISVLTAIILPFAIAAPVPDKDTSTPQIIPIPAPSAIQALIDSGLTPSPADIAYVTGVIAAAEAAAEAAAAQKASGSISTRQLDGLTSALGPLLGLLGTLGIPIVKRDEDIKRQISGVDLGSVAAGLPIIGPILGAVDGSIPDVGGVLKRDDLPPIPIVGSLPGVAGIAGITDDLPPPLGSLGAVVGGVLQNPNSVTSLASGIKERV